ncbi:DUF58 domain-containing protein [candidate division LCP-89 bacterium B3_LCP]|uniref:DUF58 domain-containing protein n=1 Tax=candidate division LCP-89 bacterium B3_LCP TaxID=2012998 RepID=A0A532UXR9_UNCL8|nr:MAG: DUF58 domain-containing protein [candidate division LCP-89 bacterium B3_LCP]
MPQAQLLKPQELARLSNLQLLARRVVEGFITGLHQSPYHGFSVEFAEHRPYLPGDSIRNIDWKVYARTDRFVIKRFEEETNLKGYILLDSSASMAFGSGSLSKLQYGIQLTAALSHLMIEQRDAVGLAIFDQKIKRLLPPRSVRSYLSQIFSELVNLEPSGKTGIAETLHRVAERMQRRGLVILISDLLDEPEEIISGLRHFRYDGHEVIVLQVIDPLERSFAFPRDARFRDLETDERIISQPWHLKDAYQKEMKGFLDELKSGCRENRVDYALFDTSQPFDFALMEYLNKRKRLY